MKHAIIKVSFEDTINLSKVLLTVSKHITKGESKNGIAFGKTNASFVISEIDIQKQEREIRHEEINGVNYLIVKSNI